MSKYYNFRNLDILFVDDNKNMHSLLKSLLLAMNVVNSRGCYTSEECFDCMLEEAPDIVITDMSLNPENGIDLIRRKGRGSLYTYPGSLWTNCLETCDYGARCWCDGVSGKACLSWLSA